MAVKTLGFVSGDGKGGQRFREERECPLVDRSCCWKRKEGPREETIGLSLDKGHGQVPKEAYIFFF